MINEVAVAALRDASRRASPAATARLLDSLLPEGLRQDTLIFYLKRALPSIPSRFCSMLKHGTQLVQEMLRTQNSMRCYGLGGPPSISMTFSRSP